MKGLTLDQFKEVIEFVQEYHAFGKYKNPEKRAENKEKYPNIAEYGMGIKYVDSCYDSRDNTIWSVTFRQGVRGVVFSTNKYNAFNLPPDDWNYNKLYDLCMDFLKGEFKPTEDFYSKVKL